MNADKSTIRAKLEIVDRNMRYLEEVNETFDPNEADYTLLQAVKHSLFEITEACIDIASHIVAAEGYERPPDYAGLFPVLADNGLLSATLAERLADMARFRNVLVHQYGDLDVQRLQSFIEEDLDDVTSYTAAIYEYLDA